MEIPNRLLYPADYDRNSEIPMKDFAFIHALSIDEMVVLIKESHRGFGDLKLENFFSTDPLVLAHRLDVVRDLVEQPTLYELFCKAIPMIQNIHDMRRAINSDANVESALSSIRYLETYQEIVDLFAKGFSGISPSSRGLQDLKESVMAIHDGEEYQNLNKELSKMELRFGTLKSVTIGVNLDENLQVREAGLVSVNDKSYHAGNIMERMLIPKTGKKNTADSYLLLSPLYSMTKGLHGEDYKKLNNSIRTSLEGVFTKAIKQFEPVVQKYFSINTSGFTALLDDIRFLTAGVKFILDMQNAGFSMCAPTIAPMEEKKCDLKGVYNPILARKDVEAQVISNDFAFDENGRFYLVTGPNHGGKSIFAYSIGMAQALFQLGLYIPAQSAHMSPVSGIFTHFPSSDENNYGKGRLESECARLGAILQKLSDTDMLLMDESFSSTSGLEAGYIATEVLTGIGVIGCGGIFVTHIHDLPQQLDTYNSHPDNKGRIDNLVAQMEDKENGKRSYRIRRTTPEGLSYARDIAMQYGLNLDSILQTKQS